MAGDGASKAAVEEPEVLSDCDAASDEEPSEEMVLEYAEYIGIDPVKEPHLMWIAREGVAAPVPLPWKACREPKAGGEEGDSDVYYFNFETEQSIWDHPLDNHFRALVEKHRKEALDKSGTSISAKTSDEAPLMSVAKTPDGGQIEDLDKSGSGSSLSEAVTSIEEDALPSSPSPSTTGLALAKVVAGGVAPGATGVSSPTRTTAGQELLRPPARLDHHLHSAARGISGSCGSNSARSNVSEVSEDFRSDWAQSVELHSPLLTPRGASCTDPTASEGAAGHSLEISMTMSMEADHAYNMPSHGSTSPLLQVSVPSLLPAIDEGASVTPPRVAGGSRLAPHSRIAAKTWRSLKIDVEALAKVLAEIQGIRTSQQNYLRRLKAGR